jgi:hypothetical protein
LHCFCFAAHVTGVDDVVSSENVEKNLLRLCSETVEKNNIDLLRKLNFPVRRREKMLI